MEIIGLIIAVVAGAFGLLGIISGIVGLIWWQNVRQFVQTAEHAEGTVIELIMGGKGYRPVVEFTDRFGQRHEYRSGIGTNPSRYSVGDRVQMVYDQNDIASAKINHWLHLYLYPGLALFVAFGFVTVAVVSFVSVWFFILAYTTNG